MGYGNKKTCSRKHDEKKRIYTHESPSIKKKSWTHEGPSIQKNREREKDSPCPKKENGEIWFMKGVYTSST